MKRVTAFIHRLMAKSPNIFPQLSTGIGLHNMYYAHTGRSVFPTDCLYSVVLWTRYCRLLRRIAPDKRNGGPGVLRTAAYRYLTKRYQSCSSTSKQLVLPGTGQFA